jgi:hypothetical protein
MKYLALLLVVFLASCASEEEPIPIDKTGAMTPPKLVGRVATVPSDRRFVLIQSYGAWKVPIGTILTTRGGEERSANLLVTGETMGQYAAADLQSGEVLTGDAVYSRDFAPQSSAAPEAIQSPHKPIVP